jgi:uncharacterized protein YigA (DUF484 family)
MSKLSEEQITSYLLANPDFLVKHPDVLAQLELQQQAQGATSLVHIQQRQLREHNTRLKKQIDTMSKHAVQNERVYSLLSQCHRQLWRHDDFDAIAKNLHAIVCSNDDISDFKLLKYTPDFDELIEHRLSNSGYYLGRITTQERALLFRDDTQSAAIYLISDAKQPSAILAFGSNNVNHFEPAQDNLFMLDFISALQLRLQKLA